MRCNACFCPYCIFDTLFTTPPANRMHWARWNCDRCAVALRWDFVSRIVFLQYRRSLCHLFVFRHLCFVCIRWLLHALMPRQAIASLLLQQAHAFLQVSQSMLINVTYVNGHLLATAIATALRKQASKRIHPSIYCSTHRLVLRCSNGSTVAR